MTFKQKLIQELVNSGFNSKQSESIQELVVDSIPTMKTRWNDLPNDFPLVVWGIIWSSTCKIALEWIDSNIPNAWFRRLFDSTDPIHLEVLQVS